VFLMDEVPLCFLWARYPCVSYGRGTPVAKPPKSLSVSRTRPSLPGSSAHVSAYHHIYQHISTCIGISAHISAYQHIHQHISTYISAYQHIYQHISNISSFADVSGSDIADMSAHISAALHIHLRILKYSR
jgi:hypothetical protein